MGPDPIDTNFQLATGAFIATSKTGEVLEARDVYVTNCGVPVADYNLVFLKRPGYKVEAALDRAARYFESSGLPYRVSVRADQADSCRRVSSERGFVERAPVPGMRLSPLPAIPEAPAGVEVRRVADAETLADFQQTAFEGFGLPTAAAPLFITENFVALPDVALFVGYVDGQPACTAALVATAGVAGVYWVATREGLRGCGYGAAITWEAVRAGQDRGCGVASLQASDMGRPVYERMGFVRDREYARFDSPTPG